MDTPEETWKRWRGETIAEARNISFQLVPEPGNPGKMLLRKIILLQDLNLDEKLAAEEEFHSAQQLLELSHPSSEAAGSLAPHLPKILHASHEEDQIQILFDPPHAIPLDCVAKQQKLEFSTLSFWAIQICQILQFLQQQGMTRLFRWYRREEYFIAREGESGESLLLAGLGLSQVLRKLSRTSSLPPSSSAGQGLSDAQDLVNLQRYDDLYRLGTLLYSLSMGKEFQGDLSSLGSGEAPAEFPMEWEEIFERTLDFSLPDRFNSVLEAEERIQQIAEESARRPHDALQSLREVRLIHTPPDPGAHASAPALRWLSRALKPAGKATSAVLRVTSPGLTFLGKKIWKVISFPFESLYNSGREILLQALDSLAILWSLLASPAVRHGKKVLTAATAERDQERDRLLLLEEIGVHRRSLSESLWSLPGFKQVSAVWLHYFPKKIPRREIAIFARQLATLVRSGVTLSRAIQIIARQASHPQIRETMVDLALNLSRGRSLSLALNRYPSFFPHLYVTMIGIAETAGGLDQCLDKIAEYEEKKLSLVSRIGQAMVYPFVILGIFVLVSFFLLNYIFPNFVKLFEEAKVALPLTTKFLMLLVKVMRNPPSVGVLLLAISGFSFYFWSYLKTPLGKVHWDTWKIRIPYLGKVIQRAALTRFSWAVGLLYSSGVNYTEALELSSEASGNEAINDAIRESVKVLKQGGTFSEALQKTRNVPKMVTSMLALGEETGEVEHLLQKISDLYEIEIEHTLSTFSTLIEPFLITCMGFMVGIVMYALLVPLYYMLAALK